MRSKSANRRIVLALLGGVAVFVAIRAGISYRDQHRTYVTLRNKSGQELTDVRIISGPGLKDARFIMGERIKLPNLSVGESRDVRVYPDNTRYVRLFFRDRAQIQHSYADHYVEGGVDFNINPDLTVAENGLISSTRSSIDQTGARERSFKTLMSSSDGDTRLRALSLLTVASSTDAEFFIQALQDPDPRIRSGVLDYFNACPALPERAAPLLLKSLRNAGLPQKDLILHCLGDMGPRAQSAVQPLIPLLQDPALAWVAVETLELIDTPEARKAVEAYWSHPPEITPLRK